MYHQPTIYFVLRSIVLLSNALELPEPVYITWIAMIIDGIFIHKNVIHLQF